MTMTLTSRRLAQVGMAALAKVALTAALLSACGGADVEPATWDRVSQILYEKSCAAARTCHSVAKADGVG